MTEQIIAELIAELMNPNIPKNEREHAAVREIERLREALAQPPLPVQEPLEYWNAVEGWVKIEEVREHFDSVGCGTIYKTAGEDRVPVYVTPPQRTWVGLTDEEAQEAFARHNCTVSTDLAGILARAISARLKKKNNG
jgi:hypothetical protein